jgi:hypothetical protein
VPAKATPVIISAPTVNGAAPRVDQPHAGVLLQSDADRAAEHAAEIGGEERQPREQRNLFQVESAHGCQIERQPERQRAPRRIGEKPRDGDAPEVSFTDKRGDRGPAGSGEVRFLPGENVSRSRAERPLCFDGEW